MSDSPSGPLTGEKQRFYLLDALRGLAAIVVLQIHLRGEAWQIFGSRYVAVDFFFVLSGFVLAQAYGERHLSFASFLRIRLIRLYPLYLIGTLLGVLAAALSGPDSSVYLPLITNILFLPAAFDNKTPGRRVPVRRNHPGCRSPDLGRIGP